MSATIIGIRHHSPACARLVRQTIERDRPFAVLIEGPSDFNPRIDELLLGHTLPVALYSYANSGPRPAQCWFPFVDYSPEWVALNAARAVGALTRFIDLPHWQYRALPDARQRTATVEAHDERPRYGRVSDALCERFHCDSDDALWDHLFESAPADSDATALHELHQRLTLYFDELRGDDPGAAQDQAREACMARWVAWAVRAAREAGSSAPVLVVCGGWHQRAIASQWPLLDQPQAPVIEQPNDEREAGCYLVPYAYRQVDALAGYGAGMPSPLYYQWAWTDGLAAAGEQALREIVQRLRQRKVAVSTADVIAFEAMREGLARLRGHVVPLRVDLLDALQSAVVKEALDAPAPWSTDRLLSSRHHPVLREALIALTGAGQGELHSATPLPPLVHDVKRQLAACGIEPQRTPANVVLDRRRAADAAKAQLLWRLQLIGVAGVQLTAMHAPNAARGLSEALKFEEHWTIAQDDRWYPDLIEAAAWGATLEAAARQCLLERVASTPDVRALADALMQAVRAGLAELGPELATRLQEAVPSVHDHAALAAAAQSLADVAQAGFWGTDTHGLLDAGLAVMADRLLWLIDGHPATQPGGLAGDVAAVKVFDALLRLDLPGLDRAFVLQTFARFGRSAQRPACIRGAALGVAYVHDALGDDAAGQITAVTRALPVQDALGDFLYGLFACARGLATGSDGIVRAVHGALEAMSAEDFLRVLPQLRGAFAWFPPRERGALAGLVAQLLGLGAAEQSLLLSLREGTAAFVDARRIEAQAMAWAREHGVIP